MPANCEVRLNESDVKQQQGLQNKTHGGDASHWQVAPTRCIQVRFEKCTLQTLEILAALGRSEPHYLHGVCMCVGRVTEPSLKGCIFWCLLQDSGLLLQEKYQCQLRCPETPLLAYLLYLFPRCVRVCMCACMCNCVCFPHSCSPSLSLILTSADFVSRIVLCSRRSKHIPPVYCDFH